MYKYIDFKNNINYSTLKDIANAVKSGSLVLFPTETVYGLGSNGLDENAVKKIFIAKHRNFNNPINLLVSNKKMIEKIAQNISPLEYNLMEAFFPGPFTIILNKRNIVPDIVTAGQNFVGVRMPSGIIARNLVEYAGVPIAAPSANISGNLSGTSFENISKDFIDIIDYAIDGGNSEIGIESTIVKVIDNIPHILRPGSITYEQIKQFSNIVIKDYENKNSNNINHSKHYTPNNECILVYSDKNEKIIEKIKEISQNKLNSCILSTHENIQFYEKFLKNTNLNHNTKIIDIGSKNNLNEIAKNIFSCLKKADNFNPEIIIIEGLKQEGIGVAIMNRLIKACNENFLYLN